MQRLYDILSEVTQQYRTGPVVQTEQRGDLAVTHVFAMPHVDEVPEGCEVVDVHFIKVGVKKAEAAAIRAELIQIINSQFDVELMKQGPSYIAVGGMVGDQGAALQLFALGEVLKLWSVITPAKLGITGPMADTMAGNGLLMISGYNPFDGWEHAVDDIRS